MTVKYKERKRKELCFPAYIKKLSTPLLLKRCLHVSNMTSYGSMHKLPGILSQNLYFNVQLFNKIFMYVLKLDKRCSRYN